MPVLAFTLSSDRYDHFALRRIAAELQTEIKQIANVSEVTIIGGYAGTGSPPWSRRTQRNTTQSP